jgi:hypothetical protein
MEEVIPPPPPPSTTAVATTAPSDPAYGPAVGRSLADKEKLRELEGVASAKSARDYQHVILAYGVLWALFAGYGIFLWRRSARLRADMNDLRQRLDPKTP